MKHFTPTGFGKTIFEARYEEDGEQWDGMADRVMSHLHDDPSIRELATNILAASRFVPAGRTLHGAGREGWQGNMINCYIFRPEDTKESIGEVLGQMYITATCGGGTGYNASDIRPKGSDVGNHRVAAPGVVSFAKMVDGIMSEVRAGGSRRAAILGAITIDHPDVLEWIRIKQQTGLNQDNLGVLSNHNISIYINDHFIDCVRNNKDWSFEFNGTAWYPYLVRRNHDHQDEFLVPAPNAARAQEIADTYYKNGYEDTFEVVRKYHLKAKWLWNKIMDSNLKCAEPAILHEDAIKRFYAVGHIEPWAGNNPCTEAVTGHLGNCTLGSLNLTQFVTPPYAGSNTEAIVEWDDLREAIRIGVRSLDSVLSLNEYPVQEQRDAAEAVRRIGLGVMGYGHMLIEMGLRYGRKDALEFTHTLAAFIRDEAFRMSIELSQELGECSVTATPEDRATYLSNPFIQSLPDDIKEGIATHGIRNSVILSIAPTGTIGSVTGVSTSIEPVFAPAFYRSYRVAEHWEKELVFDTKFKDIFESGGDLNAVVGAYDISPEEHMATIATWQQYVDQSISKTINCPKGTKLEEFSEALLRHIDNIKGVSAYLEGSRGFEPLSAVPIEEAIRLLAEQKGIKAEHLLQSCATGVCE